MSIKKWEINRRTFLRGLGVSLALPMLDAMLPSVARAADGKTRRLLWIYLANGHGARNFNAQGFYNVAAPISQALAPIKADTTTLLNLTNFTPPTRESPYKATGNAHPNSFVPFVSGGLWASDPSQMPKTFDQYIADVNAGARMKSISLVAGYEDHVYLFNPLQGHTMSFAGPDKPVPFFVDPKAIFEQLFSGGTGVQIDQRRKDQLTRKRGILHYVMEDLRKVSSSVGKDDKIRLDEYFTGVNELDQKINSELTSGGGSSSCSKPTMSTITDYTVRLKLFYDVIYHAFKCDLTRVATFMHAMEGSHLRHKSFIPSLSSNAGWHGLSHLTPNYEGSAATEDLNYEDLLKVYVWHHTQIVNFITRLKSTALPNGQNMLDECAILWGSGMAGPAHDNRGLILHMAGHANGALKKGLSLNLKNEAPVANLYLTLMQAFGSTATKVGISNGIISDLKA